MEILLPILGFGLIILAVSDLLVNSLVLNGAGKATQYISSYVWRLLWWLAGKNGRSRLLSYSGIFIIAGMFLYYLLCTWLGVWIVYLSEAGSVVSDSNGSTATALEKFYFTGYVLSTMGLGDFRPSGQFFQVVTAVFSLLGLAVMTLFISYIIPASSAGVEKQLLANYIRSMGPTPALLIKEGYNENNKAVYEEQFKELHKMILSHTEKHLAYPILHYYHSGNPETSFVVNLTKLDEAVHILKYSIPQNVVDQKNVKLLAKAITTYMRVIKNQSNFFYAPGQPAPPGDQMQDEELSFEVEKPSDEIMEEWNERRIEWQRLLLFEGWDYRHVYSNYEDE